MKTTIMKNYNYEARYEDKYNKPCLPEELKITPVHEQLNNLDDAISKLNELFRFLNDRLKCVTKPSDEGIESEKTMKEEYNSEVTKRLSVYVEKIKYLQGGVEYLLKSLEI